MLGIVGHRLSLSKIVSAMLVGRGNLEHWMSLWPSPSRLFFVDSGRSACFVILKALTAFSSKKEVVLPAYTAPALLEAVKKAGLRPILCDVSKNGFNANAETILKSITPETLCVLCVHMFGLPVTGLSRLKAMLPQGVFLIEDCAQAMGTRVEGRLVGDFSDAAFTSFNRGKNLPLYGGGYIFIRSEELAGEVNKIISEFEYPGPLAQAASFFKLLCLVLAFNRFFYGLLYCLIASSKDKVKYTLSDFKVTRGAAFQERLGVKLGEEFEVSCRKRAQNTSVLLAGLKDCRDIVLPDRKPDEEPVLNRFPVIFTDPVKKRRVKNILLKAGIETSEFYLKPLHHIFDLGYKEDEFPNASYLAEHLLTLPVHPLVEKRNLYAMVKVIKEICCR